MVNNQAYVDTAFFTQNDTCNNIVQFGTPYAEHPVQKSRSGQITYLSNLGTFKW